MINLFLSQIGLSPFAKSFLNKNIVDACIEGNQFHLLEYMIKGSSRSLPEAQRMNKYDYSKLSSVQLEYYWKSRENKDICGNNQLHLIFELDDLELRHKYLSLLIDE